MLIAVLWSLFFLAALAVVIEATITPQLGLAARLRDRAALRYLADAGVAQAILAIRADETGGYDGLYDFWAHGEDFFRAVRPSDEADGTVSLERMVQEEEEAESETHYGLTDEERRVNINTAPPRVLRALFENTAETGAQEAADLAAAVADWRDADDEPSEGGAESPYYEGLDPGYPCRNAPFVVMTELRLVRGVTPEIFEKVAGQITVYGSGAVNINTAESTVLWSLGLGEPLIEKILAFRRGDDGEEATEDDRAFEDPGAIVETMNAFAGLNAEETAELETAAGDGLLGVRSEYFRGRAVGRYSQEDDLSSAVTFVIGRDEKIRYWRED